jgi:OmpA-OmpF porin, OOP family
MATDLLDLVTKGLGSDFTSKIAGIVGESPQATQGVLASGLPLLFSGLANKAGAPDGASDVLNLLTNFGAADTQLSDIGGLLSGGGLGGLGTAGNTIISALFGNKSNGISSALAGLAGVKPGSATTLLSALAPLAFGVLRKYTASHGLGASGLASLLLGQRDSFARQVPESLSRAAGFGPVSHITAKQESPSKSSGFLRWLPWIIGAVLALWLLSRCTSQKEVAPVEAVPAPVTETVPAAQIDLEKPVVTTGGGEERAARRVEVSVR